MIETTLMAMNWGWQAFLVTSLFCTFMLLSMLSYVAMPVVNRWIVGLLSLREERKQGRLIASLAEQIDE